MLGKVVMIPLLSQNANETIVDVLSQFRAFSFHHQSRNESILNDIIIIESVLLPEVVFAKDKRDLMTSRMTSIYSKIFEENTSALTERVFVLKSLLFSDEVQRVDVSQFIIVFSYLC